MNTTSVWRSGRPISRVLLSAIAAASLGLTAIQAEPAIAQAPLPEADVHAAQAQLKPLLVGIRRVDSNTSFKVGTVLRFALSVQNVNGLDAYSGTYTIFPSSSSISNVAFKAEGTPSCRWQGKQGPLIENCTSSTNLDLIHVVTQEDLDRGYFVATATFEMSRDALGKERLAPSGAGQLVVELPKDTDPSSPAKAIKIAWARNDDLGDKVYVGDKIQWNITITNKTGQVGVSFPRDANVSGALTSQRPNCRYIGLADNGSYTCSVHHVVQEDDLKNGKFTPRIKVDLTSDVGGNAVLIPGSFAEGPEVPISPGERPRDPNAPRVLANPGDHGFACHRIPALTTAPNGWLLAAWDGRPNNCADSPNPNSIIQWISKDNGKTWEAADRKVVAAGQPGAQKFGYSDPSYVVDRETNKIYMFFVKSFDQSFQNSQRGTDEKNRNVLHAAVIESSDNGLTWTEPKVITSAIQPEGDANGQVWFSRFAASGEGIQKRFGPNKGRLIQQYTFRKNDGYYATSVFSDDHGATWKAGKPIGPGMDENKVVELSDGRLLLNSRRSDGVKNRRVAVSSDGGATWTDLKDEAKLIDPNNNASIHRAFPQAPMDSACAKVLLFSNAANTSSRQNGVVSVSLDDGSTWRQALTFKRGSMAYSTLTALPGVNGSLDSGKYGILYEAENNAITYKPFNFADLNIDDGKKQELLDTCVTKAPTPPPAQPPAPAPAPAPLPPAPPAPAPQPQPQPTPDTRPEGVGSVTRVAGESRVETATAVSKVDFKDGAPVAILARADVHADAAAAVPLAKHLNAPVLLSQPDVLHPKTLEELKRLKAKKVLIMGGKVAISEKAEAELVKAGFTVERTAGENRAATAVRIATTLASAGKAKQVLIADGADWQPSMIAGPAAAKVDGVTLLTNGKTQAPETAKYLAELKAQTVAIGDAAKEAVAATDAVTAANPTALSLAVAERFFKQDAPAAGIATTADFADALTGGAHVARRNSPLLLSEPKLADPLLTWVRGATTARSVFVYGGETRFADAELARLTAK